MLLMATSMWAGDVVVIKQLNGIVNNNVGTVEAQVSQASGLCTLTVTPATGYYIDAITAEKTISGDLAQGRGDSPAINNFLTVTATDATADPSGSTTWTFTMPSTEYDVEVVANFKQRANISNAVVTLAETTFTYDGEYKTPAVSSVVLSGQTLSESDYDVAYKDNVDAGTATVTVTGKRTYTGEATATFTINKAPLNLTVSMDGWVYDIEPSDPREPQVDGNEGEGSETFYYKVKGAADNTYTTEQPVNAGTYVVKVEVGETANYAAASATSEFTISKAELNLSVTITGWTYGDDPNAPQVSGNLGNGALTVSYRPDEEGGQFTSDVPVNHGYYIVKVEVAETANYFGGEAEASFYLRWANFENVIIADIANQSYTGEDITPAVTVTYKGKTVDPSEYTASYADNTNVGQATVYLMPNRINFYLEGNPPSKTFNIVPAEAVITAQDQTVTYDGDYQEYNNFSVDNGSVIVRYYASERDREAEDGEELEVVVDAGTYYVKLEQADDNYTSAPVNATFTIAPKELTNDLIWSEESEYIYDGTEQTLGAETFGLYDDEIGEDGQELMYGEDYTISYTNNINVGTATATITGIGNYTGTLTYNFKIVREMNISFATNSWASYYAAEDLALPENLLAYIVTGIGEDAVVVEPIDYIPSHVGVLLTTDPMLEYVYTDYIIAEAYEGPTQEFDDNLLKGCSSKTAVTNLTAEGQSIYVLYNDEFVKTTKGNIPAFRCYLEIDGLSSFAANSRFGINVADDDTTGIDSMNNEQSAKNNALYDLNGRRLNNTQLKKGLYIMNGKKVVIK